MKRIFLVLLCVGALVAFSGVAGAYVLTFDDITTSDSTSVPDGYGELNWDNFNVLNAPVMYPSSGYNNGRVSGNYVAYNAWAEVATVGESYFDFNSVYLTAAWNTGLHINVKGYANSVLNYEQEVIVDPWGPTLFNFGFEMIDRLVFTSFGGVNAGFGYSGEHFAMDNMYTNKDVVPEPATMLLLGSGLVGLAGFGRKKLRKKG